MFKTGEFSKLCGLSADTLYHYEDQKILMPRYVDPYTGYRYYEASQMVTVNKILALKDAGFTLTEIAHLIQDDTPVPSLLSMLEDKALILANVLEEEQNRLERLHTNIFLIKNGGIPLMNEVVIKSVEPVLIASTRRVFDKSKFDESLGQMWTEVNQRIDEKGAKRTIPCLMMYHSGWWNLSELNLNYDEKTLDTEVAEPITKNFEGNDNVKIYELPRVERMACIVHNGPFQTIGTAFDTLFEWLIQNNYVVDGPIREIYHKGEWATKDPNEYVTELQVPVKR